MVTFEGSVKSIPGVISYAAKGACLSTDTKPTNVGNGSILLEMDTGKTYAFDAEGEEWIEVSSGGSSGGGGGDSINWIMPEQTVTLVDRPVEVTGVDFGLIPMRVSSVPLKIISEGIGGEPVITYKELLYYRGSEESLSNDYFFVGVVDGKMSFYYFEDEEIVSGTYTISIGLF